MTKITTHPFGVRESSSKKPEATPDTLPCKVCKTPVKVVEGVCLFCGELLKMPKPKRR